MLKKSLNPRVDVNPAILVWARTSSRMTPDQAVKRLKIGNLMSKTAVERLADLEKGYSRPKRSTLVKMAKVYRRPLLTFYLSKPPNKVDRGIDFRSFPHMKQTDSNDNLDVLLRDIRTRQSMVRSVMEEEEENRLISFVGSHKTSDGTDALVRSLREVLKIGQRDVDFGDYDSNDSSENQFNFLRERAEQAGVFVILQGDLGSYHTKFFADEFRGFAIADKVAPFIVVNHYDTFPALTITLLHELTHILLGQTCFSNSRTEHHVEQFCNEVAARILLPSFELKRLDISELASYNLLVERFSEFCSMRNFAVFRKLPNSPLVGRANNDMFGVRYETYSLKKISSSVFPEYSNDANGVYYSVHRHRIGKLLLEFVNRMLRNGSLTSTKSAKVLGVNPHIVHKLLSY